MRDEDKKKALHSILWLRVKYVRVQSRKALSSPFFASRNRIMGQERAVRAKVWAVVDDRADEENRRAKAGLPPLSPAMPSYVSKPSPSPAPIPPFGVSIWPFIDSIYKASNFPAINLTQFVTQTRKNTGGMLVIGFTLKGRINITLGWDANCFPEGVVDEFGKSYWRILVCVGKGVRDRKVDIVMRRGDFDPMTSQGTEARQWT